MAPGDRQPVGPGLVIRMHFEPNVTQARRIGGVNANDGIVAAIGDSQIVYVRKPAKWGRLLCRVGRIRGKREGLPVRYRKSSYGRRSARRGGPAVIQTGILVLIDDRLSGAAIRN